MSSPNRRITHIRFSIPIYYIYNIVVIFKSERRVIIEIINYITDDCLEIIYIAKIWTLDIIKLNENKNNIYI